MTIPKIQIIGIKKYFDEKRILDGVDIDVMAGESAIIIGMSGTGKSVLLKCILGLIKPDAGRILIDGEDWCALPYDAHLHRMRRIGMLFQGGALFDSMPVWRNVAFTLLRDGMSEKKARIRAGEMLEMVELPGTEERMPAELSGGMVKRISLARAICHRPDIVFYDEPLTGLDPVMAAIITQVMKHLHEEFHTTSLTIAHSMMLTRVFADRVTMLYHGRVRKTMPVSDLDDCTDPIVCQFVQGKAKGAIQMRVEPEQEYDL